MKRTFFILVKKIAFAALLFISFNASGQDCRDTSAAFTDCASCFTLDFNPVCGCDNKNYRNECEVYNCARLRSDSSTICDYVEFEIRPTLLTTTPDFQLSSVLKISVYMKYSGSAYIQIYNVFGKIMYEVALVATRDNVFLPGNDLRGSSPKYLEIPEIASFQRGVYIVTVSANSQIKSKKIVKI